MAFSYACLVLQRVLMPTLLVLAALFRPVGISFVYLFMFFISPFIPIATSRNFTRSVTAYLIILIAQSTIVILCHVALQVTIIALNIDTLFGCSFTSQLLRHIGFIDFRNLQALAIVEWLAPEVVVFIASLVVYLVTKRLTVQSVPSQLENGEGDAAREALQNDLQQGSHTNSVTGAASAAAMPAVRASTSSTVGAVAGASRPSSSTANDGPNFDRLIQISPLFCLATLFFAGVLRPSVPGGFYFLIFLLSGSYWATFQTLKRGFALLLRFVMVVIILHTLCIVAYQTPWIQQHLDNANIIARLIGLEPLITSSCSTDIRIIVFETSFKLDSYLSPIVLCFSFYALALTTKNLMNPRIVEKPPVGASGQQLEKGNNKFSRQISLMTQTSRGSKKDGWSRTQQRLNVSLRREHRPTKTEPTETTPLVRHGTRRMRSVSQNESFMGVSGMPSSGDIPLETRMSIRSVDDEANASLFDQISYGIISVGGFIYQNSYIFTNILMMAWSIVYHSWLTFVLLLWANVLWMIPNQRKAMMRSSPFIVLYAELLVVAQYIYGMDLTNDELPSKVDMTGINLAQIGFERPQENGMQPCVPLIVKTAFLLMFWVTLRQFFKEKGEKRRSSGIVDMMAPLHLTVQATTTNFGTPENKKTSKFLKKAGDIIKNLLVRLWIWLLVLVIFLCAITGKQMTGFRICYMALFLFFLLVFQSSSKAWVKVMYGFWLFLIFYAMSILILIYTYQFDKFDQYWNDYLNISKTLQTDIGLERYKTKDLFLHLVSPTIIVILTVIQVHYFHKRFIASLHQQSLSGEAVANSPLQRGSSVSARSFTNTSNILGQDMADFEQSVKDLIRITIKKMRIKIKRFLKNFKDIIWRFLELHIMKAVYITAFVCCVSEVCVLHIAFAGLCLLGLISRHTVKIFISRIISFIVTIIILTKMIYQIAYLDHSRYDITCPNTNITENNAVWFGFEKATDARGGLMGLLKSYIIYMVMVTLHAVVGLRQYQMRHATGKANEAMPKVLFPSVYRADAEKNLQNMFKYLLNYGFYKFGMEISLITLVATITYRQDIVAVAYAMWLFVLLLFDRSRCAKVWGIFQCFIGVSTFLQYLLLVGLPPSLCLTFPWTDSEHSESIQRWALLPGNLHYSHVSKLIFDFVLLMTVNRQKSVFNIELRSPHGYAGGTNKSVVDDIANLGQVPFENPTHDFLSHVRNYLDVFKNGILCGFYWITLAVVFLAGTNISDFLAIGYLIGAFIFLWQGSDFYLRPINVIIKRWNWLITYNVANILIKTCLQMAGCIYMKELEQNCCWFVHVLGITCASNPTVSHLPDETTASNHDCPATTTQIVLLWDAVCFAFLLLQMRIFKSHYFCHIIIDTKANNILTSRGAEIIEDLRQKQIQHRHEHEKDVLLKIKRKMEKIRATQQKMLRPIDKPTHFDEHGYPVPGSRAYKRKEVKLHPQDSDGTSVWFEALMDYIHGPAVRAGDYYMFEDVDEKFELDLIEDEVDFLEDEGKITESEKKISRRKTLIDVWKDIQSADNRRKLYVRQRSYASAPGSRIGIKIDDESPEIVGQAGARTSTHSEPLDYVCRSTSDYFMEHTKSDKPKDQQASTSKEASSEERTEAKAKPDIASGEVTEKDSDEDIDANPIVRLLEGFLVSLTMRLNRFSRNYRYVNKILAQEKKALKESDNLHRYGRSRAPASFSMFKRALDSDEQTHTNNHTNNTPITNTNNTDTDTTAINNLPLQSPSQDEQSQQPQHPQVVEIIEMPLDTVDAKADRQEPGSSNTLAHGRISEALPEIRIKGPSCDRSHDGSGSLSKHWSYEKVDRTSDFDFEEDDFTTRDHNIMVEVLIATWYALLSNTDIICYIVVFINQVVNASIISLPLPLMVFLWGTLSLPRPTKTFWVTLIAYTQAVVLIKCIFQFKLIWANYNHLPNQPLTLAKIFGVELNPNYASYDLLLLLVLFFHRFILKSQGVWKSEYNDGIDIRSLSDSKLSIAQSSNAEMLITNENSAAVAVPASSQVSQQQISQNDQLSEVVEEEQPPFNTELKERLQRAKYMSSVRKFFSNMVKKARLPSDVYALMFLCDFINFFVLLFGFTAFGSQQSEGDGGVQTYLAENKVPVPFLIMLLVQFILIVVDRALYLRKALVNKIIFHFLSVIGIHIWMFFVVPAVTERSFYSLAPPIIFYIIKCFYLLLSSYQIKCGYPKRILGNFLTKGFTLANMISFKVYMQMPFLYELRTILDWVCTDTTMTLFDWLKMEDIFSDIYFIKCSRQMETDFPAIRAQKKALISKLFLGGVIILLIVVSIWGPLCLFALGNAVGQPNTPYEVSVSIRIGPYDPMYTMNNRESIYTFDDKMYSDIQNTYIKDRPAITFLSGYDAEDVAVVKLAANSPSMWNISPPDKDRLLRDLENNITLFARFTYSLTRVPPAKGLTGVVGDEITFLMNETFEGRPAMINMLKGKGSSEMVRLPNMVPKFIKVLNSGDTAVVQALMTGVDVYRPLVMKFNANNINNEVWWEIHDDCEDPFYINTLSKWPFTNCESGIVMFTFNDKKFPSTFSFLTAGGIIGLYTTFVLLASRFLKSFIAGQNRKIMFEDLPYVDRVLQLCLDIYLVREALEFALEEDLFAKLLFLYRSPETMIKWTRPKEEINDDETDTESVRSRNSGRRLEAQ